MAFRRIDTIEQAIMAHVVLQIVCQRCSRSNTMWAWHLRDKAPAVLALKLKQPVRGFYCRGCRLAVTVFITAQGPW